MGNDIWGGETNPACLANIKKKVVNLNSEKPLAAAQESSELKDAQQSLGDEILKSSASENYNDEILGANLDQTEAVSSQTGSSGVNSSAFDNASGSNFGSSLGGANGSSNFTAASGSVNFNASGGTANFGGSVGGGNFNADNRSNFNNNDGNLKFNGGYDEGYSASSKIAAKAYDINKAYVFYMFLGPFGAHRFYLRRIISAIFQLLGGLVFFVWLCLIVIAALMVIMSDSELATLINSSRPDVAAKISHVRDIKQAFFHFMVIFSVPNVLFLIWLISDFFRLPDMVRKLNVSVGAGAIPYVYTDDAKERSENLSTAKTTLYIAFGLEALNAVGRYIKDADKVGALEGVGLISMICMAVGLYFLARTIRSTDLLSNAVIAGIFSAISAIIIVFTGFGLFKPSVFTLGICCVCAAVYLIYQLLVGKELYDCSGEKNYLRTFYVIAATEIVTLVLTALGSQLFILVSAIGWIAVVVLGAAAVYGTREVTASKGGYDLAHLASHIRQMNGREF
mgnify:CR=1 FL=1